MTDARVWRAAQFSHEDGPPIGERAVLVGYLGWQRATLLAICAGLTGEQLAVAASPPSTLTLLGLLRHMAKVERIWLRQRAAGEAIGSPYEKGLGKDADFEDLDPTRAPQDWQRLVDEWAGCDAAVASTALDATVDVHGEPYELRRIYVHLIQEYARHNGHADLLRQAIDGVTAR